MEQADELWELTCSGVPDPADMKSTAAEAEIPPSRKVAVKPRELSSPL
jgi:hypothetical protein